MPILFSAAVSLPKAVETATQEGQSLFERLTPLQRAEVVLSLLAICLLMFFFVLVVITGGRYVRRLVAASRGPSRPVADDWYRRPLAPREEETSDSDPPLTS